MGVFIGLKSCECAQRSVTIFKRERVIKDDLKRPRPLK